MRVLWPTSGVTGESGAEEVDLHAFYADDWIGRGGMRANFISSADGAVSVAGLSRGLQTPGDNRVFAALRDLADVVVVGADTARAETYRAAAPSAERRAVRLSYGLPPVPAMAVVSRSLDVDLTLPVFADARPDLPTLLITTPAASGQRRAAILDAIAGGANIRLIDTPSVTGGNLSVRAAARELEALGFRHQLCEGGPRLFASALLDGAVDELCLSVSPILVGPGPSRITAGDAWPADTLSRMRLIGLLAEDDVLFCRYRLD